MPRIISDALTGDRTLRLQLKIAPEELAEIKLASECDGKYRDTWARETLVREARKCVKRHAFREKV
jgi:hypothetical protein